MVVTMKFLSCCMHTEIRSSCVCTSHIMPMRLRSRYVYAHRHTRITAYTETQLSIPSIIENNSFCRKVFILLCNSSMHKKSGHKISTSYILNCVALHLCLLVFLLLLNRNEVLGYEKKAKRHFNDFKLWTRKTDHSLHLNAFSRDLLHFKSHFE